MLEGREWNSRPPAAPEALAALRSVLPTSLPDEYFSLLSASNGGEGPLPVNPYYFQLDSAEYVALAIQGRPDLEGFVVFGSNGGGEFIAFDARGGSPYPIVMVDMVAGVESTETISPDFAEFLKLVGRN